MLKEACRCLEKSAIELIDFDKLTSLLTRLRDGVAGGENSTEELHLIKDDYRMRIMGMLKALVVCHPEDDDMRIISQLSGSLEGIQAKELILLYRRTASRFRKNFPASFKYAGLSSRPAPVGNWMEHKI